MRLAELQGAFWSAVRQRGKPPANLDELFTSGIKQSATERLGVYHIAYWHRQLTALCSTFPRTRELLGERFEPLSFGYVEAKPCHEPCIELLGARFPEYLAERNDVSPVALGVAQLEWAATSALLAKDAAPLSSLPRDLGASFIEHTLEFAPSLRVAHVSRSALDWFEGSHSPRPTPDQAHGIDVAFYRPALAVKHVSLAPDEAKAYELARGGATIAVICSAFSELPDDQATARAFSVLSSWFVRTWVIACHAKSPPST